MSENNALAVDGQVDRIERLHADPPLEWENTVWTTGEIDGETALIETAIVECPDCGARAFWAKGIVACAHCQLRQRLIG